MSNTQKSDKLMWLLIGLSLAAGLFGVTLFTELGQLLNLPSDWLYAIYPQLVWISAVLILCALYVLYQHLKHGKMSRRLVIGYVVVVVGMVFITNFFVPNIWLRGHHYTAQYISITAADSLLEEEADVFVLEIGGEARAYPRDWMMLPHIAGDTLAGEPVTMTYCALSNLPQAYSSSIDGKPAHLKVVSQVHNNLVMVDKNTGELFQQITSSTPDQRLQLDPRAAQRMPWRSFKELYPDGKVFRVEESGIYALIDKITYALFVSGLEPHYNGPDPLFPTLRRDDNRLPDKERIWGLNMGGEQVAYTRSYLERENLHNTTIGGQPVLVAWFPKHETLGVFSRSVDGRVIEVSDVDVYGNTNEGKLKRLPQYPHVFWMVWSHWYPQTKVEN